VHTPSPDPDVGFTRRVVYVHCYGGVDRTGELWWYNVNVSSANNEQVRAYSMAVKGVRLEMIINGDAWYVFPKPTRIAAFMMEGTAGTVLRARCDTFECPMW